MTLRLLDPNIAADAAEIADFRAGGWFFVDTYDEQLAELRQIRDPKSIGKESAPLAADPGERIAVYDWRKALVRIVGPEAYRELRTNRNRDLLTSEEQERFGAARIGFAGLNVGNPGAVAIALEGGASSMKLADFDPLSLTNLNRFRAGLPDLGVNKATLTARQILEVDPYYELELYEKGLAPDTVEPFLTAPKLDLLVEEMDALPLKLSVREVAKKAGIPVIMVTGNSEGVLLDVERYDTEPDLPLLNGLMEERVLSAIREPKGLMIPAEKVALARDFMGIKYLDSRLVDSFAKFGTELVGIPQLAESSFMRGAALCFAAKAIILGRPLPSGRYSFSFAEQLKPV
ncbi:MAG TPA: ThiF family adenylyltransferase [Candidatus Paceibacterota bacterium]|nr:ThiF family adenylyltransferase [Candidatus Paceibacterota bacterium]